MISVSHLKNSNFCQHYANKLRDKSVKNKTWNYNNENDIQLYTIGRRYCWVLGSGSQERDCNWKGKGHSAMYEPHEKNDKILVNIQLPFFLTNYEVPQPTHQIHVYCPSYKQRQKGAAEQRHGKFSFLTWPYLWFKRLYIEHFEPNEEKNDSRGSHLQYLYCNPELIGSYFVVSQPTAEILYTL